MPSIERDGAVVAYDDVGEGPALLLGHSLLCDTRMWDPVLPVIGAGRRVLNVEARGHRRSTATRPFTVDDLAEDWLAILDEAGIDRAVLCGLSMGGMTAMRVALQAPERVAGLVLLDTSAGPQPAAGRFQYRAMAEILRAVGFARFLFPSVRKAMFGRTSLRERADVVATTEARIREHDPRQMYRAIRAIIDRGDVRPELGRIAVPTLVVVGEEDAATPPGNARAIARGIPGARLETLAHAGHLSTLEVPDVVGPLVANFLKEIDPR